MPAVEFHTGLEDPVAFACRMLRKAYRLGARVCVAAPELRLQEVDRQLWLLDERDFLPHARVDAEDAQRLLRFSPVWLAPDVKGLRDAAQARQLPMPGVLLKLELPEAELAPGFERVIELVGQEVDEAEAGRRRWRSYVAQGLAPVHHPAARA